MTISDVNNLFGDMDLLLMDLILKGKISHSDKILDAGCGSGRNMLYFLKKSHDIKGIDSKESEVHTANFMSRSLVGADTCSLGDLRKLPFENSSFDFIICTRTLHFSENEKDFHKMMSELKRVLTKKGILFLSMASQIGFADEVANLKDGKVKFQNSSVRFAMTKSLLAELELEWRHIEIPRTVLFAQEHAETTLVISPVSL